MRIISRRELVEHIEYVREFLPRRSGSGGGYSFPCDAHGSVGELNDSALHNYTKCIDGTYDVRDVGVREWDRSYWEPAVGECERCGTHVVLDGFTCTCRKCGADYNSFGQRLAPRSQWGEETGESLSDILGPIGFDVYEDF